MTRDRPNQNLLVLEIGIDVFFCPKQAKSVFFEPDKTDYVLYLLEVCLLI